MRAWTYQKGWKAPQCAGVIHTDFEKGFIRAEVIKYEDYLKYGSEAAVREAGKLGVEGKEYVVEEIATNDDEMSAFLFSLGCYSGEPITVVARKRRNLVVSIKDARYNIDIELAKAILI